MHIRHLPPLLRAHSTENAHTVTPPVPSPPLPPRTSAVPLCVVVAPPPVAGTWARSDHSTMLCVRSCSTPSARCSRSFVASTTMGIGVKARSMWPVQPWGSARGQEAGQTWKVGGSITSRAGVSPCQRERSHFHTTHAATGDTMGCAPFPSPLTDPTPSPSGVLHHAAPPPPWYPLVLRGVVVVLHALPLSPGSAPAVCPATVQQQHGFACTSRQEGRCTMGRAALVGQACWMRVPLPECRRHLTRCSVGALARLSLHACDSC